MAPYRRRQHWQDADGHIEPAIALTLAVGMAAAVFLAMIST